MGRLCGGVHEISGIKAPLFLHGWVVGGFLGWVGGGAVGSGVVRVRGGGAGGKSWGWVGSVVVLWGVGGVVVCSG